MQYKSIAVFCGSKAGNDPVFAAHASEVGKLMALQNITLVYGGGNKGLMAAVANSVLDNKGKVIGVIPEVLVEWEHQHEGLTELFVVKDMHTRKRKIYDLCDAAIILPGGFGTLDELFEMLTWNTLNIHNKKIFLLNSNGFYQHLLLHINEMEKQGFLYNDWIERLVFVEEPSAIFS
ncbi:MAG: family Rossman fold protein [Chitinophagaceae bacterium]|nr:family Rossman fold protein [Chitinophagaceae bacterium]